MRALYLAFARVVEDGRAVERPGQCSRPRRSAARLHHADAHGGGSVARHEPRCLHPSGHRSTRRRTTSTPAMPASGRSSGRTHPFAVRRVRQLVAWVSEATSTASGPASTSTVARNPRPPRSSMPPSPITGDRFRGPGPTDGCGGVQRVADQIGDWLRARPGRPTGGAGEPEDGWGRRRRRLTRPPPFILTIFRSSPYWAGVNGHRLSGCRTSGRRAQWCRTRGPIDGEHRAHRWPRAHRERREHALSGRSRAP